jgi:hypothetical protein
MRLGNSKYAPGGGELRRGRGLRQFREMGNGSHCHMKAHRQPAAVGGGKVARRQRRWWSTMGAFSQTCQAPDAIYPERAGNEAWAGWRWVD